MIKRMRVLFRMRHGLGDNAQFTIVLRHIKHYFPNWQLDMEVGAGKESYFQVQTRNLFRRKKDLYDSRRYDNILDVIWPVPKACKSEVPSTKPTRFIEDVLKVKPIEHLFEGYEIDITKKEDKLAEEYVASLPDRPFVLIHYLAKTLKHSKSLSHAEAKFICNCIKAAGCVPVILDWKNESKLPDGKTIFNPGVDNPLWQGQKLSSAGTIAALIGKAKLYVGIDSGPLHVAGATKTPSIGVWHGHHPINFFDLCDNVTHLVPRNVCKIKGSGSEVGKEYFQRKYNHAYYDDLKYTLADLITSKL